MNYAHTELTSFIIEAAMEVQRALGSGFPKDVYKRALAAELGGDGVDAQVDVMVPLYYKGEEVGERRVDMSVEGQVCVELEVNVAYRLPDTERAMNQLRASGMEAGLILAFGPCKLDYVRMHVQGCRSDILIGDSIQHRPEGVNSAGTRKVGGNEKDSSLAEKSRRWFSSWRRGRLLQ